MGVKSLAQENNTVSPAKAPTWTARSSVMCTNREATRHKHAKSDMTSVYSTIKFAHL